MTPETHPLDTYGLGGAFCVMTTPRLHAAAQEANITSINFDQEALHSIAEYMEVIESGSPLPPLVFLARLAGKATLGNPDIHWQRGIANQARFYPADHLANSKGFGSQEIIDYGRSLGALGMHELSVKLDGLETHNEEVARSLTIQRRTITMVGRGEFVPEQNRSWLSKKLREFKDTRTPDPIKFVHKHST